MKTLKSIAIVFAILFSTLITKADPTADDSNKLVVNLQSYISQMMYSPSVEIENGHDQFVRVNLTVNRDGSIVVNETNSSSALLDKEVRHRIESILINDASEYAGKQFSMVLIFKMKS